MNPKARSTTDSRFRFDVLQAEGPVLVDFYADWCRSCLQLAPILARLAEHWAGSVKVVTLDVERNPATAARLDVRGLPTLVLFDGGVEQLRLVDVLRYDTIRQLVEELVPA
jgi:thioredoxin 1